MEFRVSISVTRHQHLPVARPTPKGAYVNVQELDPNLLSQMSDFPEEELSPRTYQPGEVVEGEVVRLDDEGIIVSVGLKMEGIVPLQEMRLLATEEHGLLKPGQSITVAIVGGRGPDGMPLLSLDRALEEQRWQQLQQHLSDGTIVTVLVIDHNRGGLVVDWHGVRGFVPFSHLAPVPGNDREASLAERVHQNAEFQVLEVDRDNNRLVLSERAIWQKRRAEMQQRYLSELEEGALLSGKISSIRDFGAFVDLGDMDGLIPISELSWKMVKSPDEVVSVGDSVDVYVLRVDREKQRLTLSLKRTLPEPWETVHERYRAGQITQGTVTNLVPFGAFVKLEEGIEGLIHISELSPRRVNNPKECVYQGQQVSVMILSIDTDSRRISLSYKQAFGL